MAFFYSSFTDFTLSAILMISSSAIKEGQIGITNQCDCVCVQSCLLCESTLIVGHLQDVIAVKKVHPPWSRHTFSSILVGSWQLSGNLVGNVKQKIPQSPGGLRYV